LDNYDHAVLLESHGPLSAEVGAPHLTWIELAVPDAQGRQTYRNGTGAFHATVPRRRGCSRQPSDQTSAMQWVKIRIADYL
jgi:hypothetical protein